MKGQIMLRKTGQKTATGKDVYVAVGVVTLENGDNYKDGHQYEIIDASLWKGKDMEELNNHNSPEDLLAMKIWKPE